MSTPPKGVSPDTLDRLIGRAIELDRPAVDRLTLAQAREIALELGISPSAWDAAVAEHEQRAPASRTASAWTRFAPAISGVAGIVAGALAGRAMAAFGGPATAVSAAVLAFGGIALAVRAGRRTWWRTQLRLAAWWLGIPVGMIVANDVIAKDVAVFALLAWLASAVFASELSWVVGRFRRVISR